MPEIFVPGFVGHANCIDGVGCYRNNYLVAGNLQGLAFRPLHQIGHRCLYSSGRYSYFGDGSIAGPFVEAYNQAIAIFALLDRGDRDIAWIDAYKRMRWRKFADMRIHLRGA